MGRHSWRRGTRRPRLALTGEHAGLSRDLMALRSQVSSATSDARAAVVALTAARSRLDAIEQDDDGLSTLILDTIEGGDRLVEFAQSRLDLADERARLLTQATKRRDAVCGRSPIVVCHYDERIDARAAVDRCVTVARARMGQAESTISGLHELATRARVLTERTDATINDWYERRVAVPPIAKVIRVLMPPERGTDWWREMASILAECDGTERRKNARSLTMSSLHIVGTAWLLRYDERTARQNNRD